MQTHLISYVFKHVDNGFAMLVKAGSRAEAIELLETRYMVDPSEFQIIDSWL